MDLSKRLERAEQKVPPRPASDAFEQILTFCTTDEVRRLRDLLDEGEHTAAADSRIDELRRRADLRERHFGSCLWRNMRLRLVELTSWSIGEEWATIKSQLASAWRHKGECVGRPLDLATECTTVIGATYATALMSPGLWLGARIASWDSVVYIGTPDEIAPELATVEFNGAPMTLDAIGLSVDSYPWDVHRQWEERNGLQTNYWRANLEPIPDAAN